MRLFVVAVAVLLASPAAAGQKEIVLYLDGAVVTEVLPVVKGEAEIVLPPGAEPSSLRLRPAGCSITRVTAVSSPAAAKARKEIALLEERKATLSDRLRALDVREEIFRSAAKSQSSKAPRKTKANPDPLETVRKGTDFAIAELESVYRLRRRTEAEAKGVEESLRRLKSTASPVVTRVKVAGKGSITASYLRPDLSWRPFYDLRVEGGAVDVALHALVPASDGAKVSVAAAKVSGGGPGVPVSGEFPVVGRSRLPLKSESSSSSPNVPFSFSFLPSSEGLPPGDASCFRGADFAGSASLGSPTADGEIKVRCGG